MPAWFGSSSWLLIEGGSRLHLLPEMRVHATILLHGLPLLLDGTLADEGFAEQCLRVHGLASPLELVGERVAIHLQRSTMRLRIWVAYAALDGSP